MPTPTVAGTAPAPSLARLFGGRSGASVARYALALPSGSLVELFVQAGVIGGTWALHPLAGGALAMRLLGSIVGPAAVVRVGVLIAPANRIVVGVLLFGLGASLNALLAADLVADGAATSDAIEMVVDIFAGIGSGLVALLLLYDQSNA